MVINNIKEKSKTINFVFMGFVNAPNGAATFFKTIINNKNLLVSDSSKAKFYCQPIGLDLSTLTDTGLAHKKSSSFRVKLQKWTHSSYIFAVIGFYILTIRHGIKVVDSIKDINGDNQWVFNDLVVAYFFLKKYPDEKNLTLILHNNGDPTKMFYETFTKLGRGLTKRYIEKKAKEVIIKMDYIITLANDAKIILVNKYPDISNLAEKCSVIENGVKSAIVQSDRKDRSKIVGVSIGSISYRKGFDLLIEANNKLKDATNIELLCIGNIQDEDILKLNNNKTNIKFLGAKTAAQISQFLANADFFILCSRDEGMPISIIEAMQNKLPIFATDVGAINKMIDDKENGVLMNPSIESILKTLENIDKRKYDFNEMGSLSFSKYNEKFSVEIMLDKYKTILAV